MLDFEKNPKRPRDAFTPDILKHPQKSLVLDDRIVTIGHERLVNKTQEQGADPFLTEDPNF